MPGLRQVFTVAVFSYLVFVVSLVAAGGSYWSLVDGGFGDNDVYLALAGAIRHWDFSGIMPKQFWGVSYATAALGLATGLPDAVSLVIVSLAASLASVALCYQLWNGWVALFFAIVSSDWIQRSVLGGSESLAMALMLGGFLALRRDRWKTAATLAALATVVRPFGLLALIGLAVHLVKGRRYRDAAIATLIALCIGGAYAWPLLRYFGDPFANVGAYLDEDWGGGRPFALPLAAVLQGALSSAVPPMTKFWIAAWTGFVVTATIAAIYSGDMRRLVTARAAEATFVLFYVVALLCYNAPEWSLTMFPRFAIPVVPWLLAFHQRLLPTSRALRWGLAIVMPILAAYSVLSISISAAWGRLLH